MSMLIFVGHFYCKEDNVLKHMSSIVLLRMKIYYSFELDVLICFSMYYAEEFVTKLNRKHKIFKALFLFDIIASIIALSPLSLILL